VIAEVLNRQFVIESMRSALQDLTAPDDRREPPPPIQAQVSESELEGAQERLRTALQREEAEPTGQAEFQPDGEARRGAAGASLDDAVFISRDQTVSIFQSVLEGYFESEHPQSVRGVAADDERRSDAAALEPVTDRTLGLIDEDERRLLGGFEPTDIRWVNCLFAMALRAAEGRLHPQQLRSKATLVGRQPKGLRVNNAPRGAGHFTTG